MNHRVIKITIHKEPALYDELYSAMAEHREYDGCHIMQYAEYPENGYMVATFMLRDVGLSTRLNDR
jgi:hypothetical protein